MSQSSLFQVENVSNTYNQYTNFYKDVTFSINCKEVREEQSGRYSEVTLVVQKADFLEQYQSSNGKKYEAMLNVKRDFLMKTKLQEPASSKRKREVDSFSIENPAKKRPADMDSTRINLEEVQVQKLIPKTVSRIIITKLPKSNNNSVSPKQLPKTTANKLIQNNVSDNSPIIESKKNSDGFKLPLVPSQGRIRDLCKYYHSKGKSCKHCPFKKTELGKRKHVFSKDIQIFKQPIEFLTNPNLTFDGDLEKTQELDYTLNSILDFKIQNGEMKIKMNWAMHDNFNQSYYEPSFEPIHNAFRTGYEALAEMVDSLTNERRKKFINWMAINEKEELSRIYQFTTFNKI